MIRDSLSKYHCIFMMWEYIAGHQEKMVYWYKLTPMELANCKFDAVAKLIFLLSVNNNWKPVNIFLGEVWHYMVGSLKILGLLSNKVRNRIVKTQTSLFLFTKGRISTNCLTWLAGK